MAAEDTELEEAVVSLVAASRLFPCQELAHLGEGVDPDLLEARLGVDEPTVAAGRVLLAAARDLTSLTIKSPAVAS